jgi:hypothetical protein
MYLKLSKFRNTCQFIIDIKDRKIANLWEKNESQNLFRAIQDKIMIIIDSGNGKNTLNIGFQFFQIFLSSILFIYIYEKKNN